MNELSEIVKGKLEELVTLWSDENLNGKPAILANMLYFAIEKEIINIQEEINKKF